MSLRRKLVYYDSLCLQWSNLNTSWHVIHKVFRVTPKQNRQIQNENIHSTSKSKQSRKAQVIKQIKGQPKISSFLIPTKLSGVGGGVQTKTQTKTKKVHTIEPGSQQAHNQSDAQDKHTKHCEQGLYLAETS